MSAREELVRIIQAEAQVFRLADAILEAGYQPSNRGAAA